MDSPLDLCVALVHDWLTGMRGGERCLEDFCRVVPRADIFTLFHIPGSVSPAIERHRITTSSLQRLPGVRTHYRKLLPLFPRAVARLDLSAGRARRYDLVFSSSHCVAHGVPPCGMPHLSYCHTPMRYVWDRFSDYFGPGRPLLERLAGRLFRKPLQRWDVAASRSVDRFIANSRNVAGRIRRIYGREAQVIHPPVDCERFRAAGKVEDYYLVVSALAPYKRVDLAVRALEGLGRQLLVVGTGGEEGRLRALAGPGVRFLGGRPDEEVARWMARCRALIFPGEEDFGITPLEAMACGRPVVALGRGGALETVVDLEAPGGRDPTGVLFPEPTVESLARAVTRLESRLADFDPRRLRAHAEGFSRPRFREEIARALRDFAARPRRGEPPGEGSGEAAPPGPSPPR